VARARTRKRQREEANLPPTRGDLLIENLGLAPEKMTSSTAEDTVESGSTPPESGIPENIGGEGFQRFAATPTPDQLNDGSLTRSAAAAQHKVAVTTITAWMNLYNAITARDAAALAWTEDSTAQAQRDHALSSFSAFNEVFFPDILTPDFHEEWDEELTMAISDGQRTMLLGPQRHGKTSWGVRQVLYRIGKEPNICIGVVGKTQDLAEKTTAVVRQYLEHDPQFSSVLLPPDTSFRPPPRRGIPWTNSEFTVATRTKILKSPTVVALGIGGSILGRDFDLIIIDDPIDRKSTLSPSEREKVWEWFTTDFNSRIEQHTGVIYVGSRQHKDDLPGRIIQSNESRLSTGMEPDWKVLIYKAHDPTCHIPLIDHPDDAEDEGNDCILWPSFRSAAWLAEQERNNPDHFRRNYLNSPTSDAFRPVTSEDIDRSFETDTFLNGSPRAYGTSHENALLVASVDPAVAKKNAAVLWCYSTVNRSQPTDPYDPKSTMRNAPLRAIVEYDEPAPGSPGIVDLLDKWYRQYKVTDWVFETNYFADQIANDTKINDLKSRYGLRFHTHYTTAGNKHDPRAGLLSMLSGLRAEPPGFTMPASTESRRSMDRFVQEMLSYDPESTHYSSGRKRNLDDDLLMAAWFGWYWMERKVKGRQDTAVFEYGSGFTSFSPARWGTPPWKDIA